MVNAVINRRKLVRDFCMLELCVLDCGLLYNSFHADAHGMSLGKQAQLAGSVLTAA